jgi:hypothetical protein
VGSTSDEDHEWLRAGRAGPNKLSASPFMEWSEICDRIGWSYHDSYDRRGWARDQFKTALKKMPKDHPDRWKYVGGSRFAMFSRKSSSGVDGFLLVKIVGTILAGIALFAGISALTYGEYAWGIPILAYGGAFAFYWGRWFALRWQFAHRATFGYKTSISDIV